MNLREIAHLIPGYDPWRDSDGWDWTPGPAQEALEFWQECIKFSDGPRAGETFDLEDWQKAIIVNLYAWQRDGRRRYKEAFIFVPRKNGKMLALDTPLPTPTGWTTMGEVRVGDTLFDERGEQCKVVGVSDIDLSPESYRIEFSNGQTVRACADHQWLTTARVNEVGVGVGARGYAETWNEPQLTRVRSTRELYDTQTYGNRGDRNHSVEMPNPLAGSDGNLLLDPYVLGAWLGDGHSKAAKITSGEDDCEWMASEIRERGVPVRVHRPVDRAPNLCMAGSGFLSKLRDLGVFGRKHIPLQYKRASVAARLALLQGLMDTDGTISVGGKVIQYVSTDARLAEDVAELLASLGIKYSVRTKQARCSGRLIDSTVHMLQFVAFADELPVFRLPRKLSRMRNLASCTRQPRCRTVQVVSVTRIDPTPMRCITVDSPSHLYRFGRTMLPTHNTPTLAALLLHEMVCFPTAGGQYYSAAADRDQAALIYRDAAQMVQNDDMLSSLFSMTPSSKLIQRNGSMQFYKALSSEAHTKHGLRPCFVAVDELHAHPNAELVDTLTTGTAVKGMQPLVVYITTADYNRESVCNTKYKYACGVRDGKIADPAFLPVIYEASRQDDWTSPEVWRKANPNYGISVSEEYLARECERAKVEPSYQNTFKRLHLNIQTESVEAWFNMDQWDDCGKDEVAEDMLRNNDCFGGLDMSSTRDITAFVLFFPDGGYVLPYFWLPGETAEERQRRDGVPYTEWTQAGLIQETDKNHIDDNAIFDKICELGMRYNIRQIGFDGWQAASMFNRLSLHGFDAVKFPQTMNMMNSPSKRLESMLADGELRHGNHKVLRWMAQNTVKEQDNKGFIRPSKKHSSEKIDGIAALVMAIGTADLCDESPFEFEVW